MDLIGEEGTEKAADICQIISHLLFPRVLSSSVVKATIDVVGKFPKITSVAWKIKRIISGG